MCRRLICITILSIFIGSVHSQEIKNPINNNISTEDSLNLKIDLNYTKNLRYAIELLHMDSLKSGTENLLQVYRLKYKISHDNRVEQYSEMEFYNFLELLVSDKVTEPDKDLIREMIGEMVNLSTYTQYMLKLKNLVSKEQDSELHYRLLLYVAILRDDYNSAFQYLDKVLSINPSLLSATALKVAILYTNKQWEECRIYATKATVMSPDYAWGYLIHGICNRALGQREEAKRDIIKALELYPNYPFALNEMGVIWLSEDIDKAFVYFKRAHELNPAFDWPSYNLGLIYALKYQADSSIKYYSMAIESNPNLSIYFKRRGDVYFEVKKDYKSAIDDYTKCITLDPNESIYYENRGYAYLYNNNLDDAIYDFNKALELYDKYVEAIKGLGDCYYQKKNLLKAIEYYSKAIDLYDNYDFAYLMRGEAYINLGQERKAMKDFNKGLEINPLNKYCYTDRGSLYLFQNNISAAMVDFNMAIQIDTTYAFAYQRLGDCYYSGNDYSNALKNYDKAIGYDTTYFYSFHTRAMIYLNQNSLDLAVNDLLKAIKLNPIFDSSLGNLGWVFYLKGDFHSCISYSQKAIALNPSAFYAKFNIALATLRLGNFEDAKKLYTLYYKECKESKNNFDGAIGDLNDLIAKQIMVDEAKYIIQNILVK